METNYQILNSRLEKYDIKETFGNVDFWLKIYNLLAMYTYLINLECIKYEFLVTKIPFNIQHSQIHGYLNFILSEEIIDNNDEKSLCLKLMNKIYPNDFSFLGLTFNLELLETFPINVKNLIVMKILRHNRNQHFTNFCLPSSIDETKEYSSISTLDEVIYLISCFYFDKFKIFCIHHDSIIDNYLQLIDDNLKDYENIEVQKHLKRRVNFWNAVIKNLCKECEDFLDFKYQLYKKNLETHETVLRIIQNHETYLSNQEIRVFNDVNLLIEEKGNLFTSAVNQKLEQLTTIENQFKNNADFKYNFRDLLIKNYGVFDFKNKILDDIKDLWITFFEYFNDYLDVNGDKNISYLDEKILA